jgi:hypothetical protein
MGNPLSKRLAKIEELLANRLNAPLGYVWLRAGESREQGCIRLGYDPALADRIAYYRWLDPALGEVAPPIQHPLDPIVEAGPPDGVINAPPQPEPKPKQLERNRLRDCYVA